MKLLCNVTITTYLYKYRISSIFKLKTSWYNRKSFANCFYYIFIPIPYITYLYLSYMQGKKRKENLLTRIKRLFVPTNPALARRSFGHLTETFTDILEAKKLNVGNLLTCLNFLLWYCFILTTFKFYTKKNIKHIK